MVWTCWQLTVLFIVAVYDGGSIFPPSILDITEDDLLKKFVSVS